MRDYGKVSPQFWTGKTGKSFRGDMEAQIVAMYLMTSPHSNMIGVFHLPILYISHETGLPLEGAMKGLARCSEASFCTYDEDTETVFVHEMASHQVGEELKPADNRISGVQKQYAQMAEGRIKTAFRDRYGEAYSLPKPSKKTKPLRSPSEAPPKPGAGAGAGAEKGTGVNPPPRGGHTFAQWIESLCGKQAIPGDHHVFAYASRLGIPDDFLALAWAWFERTYGHGGQRAKKRYADWPGVFRNAVEGNWAKVWFCDGAEFRLTTVGLQLQRELKAAA